MRDAEIAYLSLGANLDDREGMIDRAVALLARECEVVARSSLYETAPVGHIDQPQFLNCAISVRTRLSPQGLLAFVKGIERELGRLPSFPCGPRRIDIDILLYGDIAIDEEGEEGSLTIPHPRMHERRFALEPLCEIAPGARHPVLGKSAQELRDALGASGGDVRRVEKR